MLDKMLTWQISNILKIQHDLFFQECKFDLEIFIEMTDMKNKIVPLWIISPDDIKHVNRIHDKRNFLSQCGGGGEIGSCYVACL
jgi:hypothetical protein